MRELKAALAVALLLVVSFPTWAQYYDRYGHALVQDSEGWVYIDRDSRPLLRPYLFDNGPDYFEDGLARFVENGKIGFHDEALTIVIPAQYDFAYPFENGAAKAGTNCRTHQEGEHSSVYCEKWESVSKPGG